MTQIQDKVYHASQRQGLTVIEPRVGTHAKAWVYAAKDLVIASIFLGAHTDFILASGVTGDQPYICERFIGAFDRAKAGVAASIYVLPGSSFQANRTSFDPELISEVAVVPSQEILIPDAKIHLLELRDSGKLEIYFYPDRPQNIPSDDSDLIALALELYVIHGHKLIGYLEREFAHDLPHVLEAVRQT